MPMTLEELVADYAAGAEAHRDGTRMLAPAKAVWAAAQAAGGGQVGTVSMKDSARRHWAIDVRRDGRGRYLQFRPVGIDLERFRASADGHRPGEWLAVEAAQWSAFAILAAGGQVEEGAGDGELTFQVRKLVDHLVREAQHQGLSFDEDED